MQIDYIYSVKIAVFSRILLFIQLIANSGNCLHLSIAVHNKRVCNVLDVNYKYKTDIPVLDSDWLSHIRSCFKLLYKHTPLFTSVCCSARAVVLESGLNII